MAKRFTDTQKWEDDWYMNLSNDFKLLYQYILDKCDAVGVWKPNRRLAEFHVGNEIDWNQFMLEMDDRLDTTKKGYWWLTKFVEFQYGTLDEGSGSKPIQSYIKLLKKHEVWEDYRKGINSLKEKEKVKVKDKEKVKEKKGDELTPYRDFYFPEFAQARESDNKSAVQGYFRFVGMIFNTEDYPNALNKPAFHILKIPNQMKFTDYLKLSSEAKRRGVNIIDLLNSMINNRKYAEGKQSLYLTLLNWVKKEPVKGTNL